MLEHGAGEKLGVLANRLGWIENTHRTLADLAARVGGEIGLLEQPRDQSGVTLVIFGDAIGVTHLPIEP